MHRVCHHLVSRLLLAHTRHVHVFPFTHTHISIVHTHTHTDTHIHTHTHTQLHSASFVGQLYRGESQTKSWSLVVSGHVTLRLVEGSGSGDWKLTAFKKDKVNTFTMIICAWQC